jgi:hypothetical protein
MKKIMFNDKYGLTQAVLEGKKTMTRRIVPKDTPLGNFVETEKKSRYRTGDVVAVAQKYMDLPNPFQGRGTTYIDAAGWRNKMFVRAEDMPHHILITDVRIERLKDISDDDCIREGIQEMEPCGETGGPLYCFSNPHEGWWFCSPREAFEVLINKICPNLTWESNPWVFVYTFSLEEYVNILPSIALSATDCFNKQTIANKYIITKNYLLNQGNVVDKDDNYRTRND